MTFYSNSFDHCKPFSDTGQKLNLSTNVGGSFTVPGDPSLIYRAEFSYTQNANVWVSLNGTAVVPIAGTSTSSPNQEFRPDIRFVKGGDVLNLITNDATGQQVGISLLQVPS